jgi:GTP-binding protein HflX
MAERVFLIGIQTSDMNAGAGAESLLELVELCANLQFEVVHSVCVNLRDPKPEFLIGSGKARELMEQAKTMDCEGIVFDVPLSPSQQRNWENASKCFTIDRHEVILDIFAKRAQTREAVIQVDLARMEYMLPRIKNAWAHLSRQRGGGVTQRGEGEMQIELDQRIVRTRISRLKTELIEVRQHRDIQRRKRLRVPVPNIAIVGYTNAGKSTLLNALTGANLLSADKLFATLDPSTRHLLLPSGQKVLLTDTVGFIRRLPHRLVEAFKATLEEAVHSQLIIHVLDISNPEVEIHSETTLAVLKELEIGNRPILTVYNKLDRLSEFDRERLQLLYGQKGLFVSAQSGEGISNLLLALEERMRPDSGFHTLLIPHERAELVSRLYQEGLVKSERVLDEGRHLTVVLPPRLRPIYECYSTELRC